MPTLTAYKMKTKGKNLYERISLFSKGEASDAYKFLGCHKEDVGFIFRVWAPKAKSVRVLGDFNNWDTNSPKMKSVSGGIWEIKIPEAKIFDNYKDKIGYIIIVIVNKLISLKEYVNC